MTQRWLAPITHISTSTPQSQITADHDVGGFNFAFSPKCQSPVFSRSPARSPVSEACISPASETIPPRRKPNLNLQLSRLDTLNHKTVRTEHEFYTSDAAGIGMAFGSPSHPPPQQYTAIHRMKSTSQRGQGSGPSSPDAAPASNNGKWKKIGGLLRTKSQNKKEPAFRPVQRIDAESHKLGVPVSRKRWRNPKSPLVQQDEFAVFQSDEPPPPIEKDAKYRQPDYFRPLGANPPQPRSTTPKIEVDIPQTALDRYSVMFGAVSGLKYFSSSEDQILAAQVNDTTSPPDQPHIKPPTLVRRVTSPTLPQFPNHHLRVASNHSPTSKYSLFPTNRRPHSPQSPLANRRPSTAPSSVHRQNNNQSALRPSDSQYSLKPTPEQRDMSTTAKPPTMNLPFPSETTADVKQEQMLLEPPPETSTKAQSSRTSSAPSELFFDIKSLRDSRGNENQQFEMTRPNSEAVQVVRSASTARRLFEAQTNINTSLELEELAHRSRSTSLDIDRAIAEVELMTSASTISSTTTLDSFSTSDDIRPESPTLHDLPIIRQPSRRIDAVPVSENIIHAVEKTTHLNTLSHHKGPTRTRAGELTIGIPSPVLEQTEECTPRTIDSSFAGQISPVSPPVATNTRHIATRAYTNHAPSLSSSSSSERLPTKLSSSTPDPDESNELKEAKFIPLSKYAPRLTAEVLARRTGLRPRPLARSATDDPASFNSGVRAHAHIPTGTPSHTRSATMPLPEISRSKSHKTITQPHGLGLTAAIKPTPTAEVSIARQISVSKPSTSSSTGKPKVVLTRSPSLRNSPNPQKVQEEVAKRVKNIDINIAMVYEGEYRHKHGASLDASFEMASVRDSVLTVVPVPPVPEAFSVTGTS